MRFGWLAFASILALCPLASVQAQVPWESPILVGPGSPPGVSFLLVDPGSGLGFMAQWQGEGERSRLGFRAGVAEDRRDDMAAFGGVDVSGNIMSASDEFPLDLIWVTGVGLGAGNDALLSVPLGVSLGRAFSGDGLWVHPYLTPRFILDAYFGDSDREDDLELGLALDVGADFSFSSSWGIRLGASVGDREGIAIGVALPGLR